MKAAILRRWRPTLIASCALLGAACSEVRVTAVDVASVSLTPDEGKVARGDTLRLRVTLLDALGNTLADRSVRWTIDRPEVARLEPNGLVRGLSEGTAIVRASSEGVTGTAAITVLEAPAITLSANELTFQARAGSSPTDTRSVEISNGGAGSLAGLQISVIHPAGEPAGWLEAGLLETTAPTALVLRANPQDLSPGAFQAQVHVSSGQAPNSPRVIEVSFDVSEEAPAIEVSPEALGFSMSEGDEAPAAQTVIVTNSGAGELSGLQIGISYEDGQPTGWLEADLAGTVAPTELNLEVSADGLESPALLEARAQITSPSAPGSMGVVSVQFRLGEPSPRSVGPCRDLDEIRADLLAIEDASPASDLADDIEDVRESVEDAYSERCMSDPADRKTAARRLQDAVDDMMAVVEDGLMGVAQGEDFLNRLLEVSRTMAEEAVEEAEARGGNWNQIVQAYAYISRGDRLWNLGAFEDAAASYRAAISRAEAA